jgi:hypothetical protein
MKELYELIDGKTAILSTKKRSFVSNFIAAWTEPDKAKDVSHSAILRPDLLVTEARGDLKPPKVVNTAFAEIISDKDLQYIYISIPKSQPDQIEAILWCNGRVGRDYDFLNLGLIQFPARFYRKLPDWAIKLLPFQNKTKQAEKRYICSELANHFVRSLIKGCSYIFSRRNISDYTPADMLDLQIVNADLFDNYYCEPSNNILHKI